MWPSAPDVRPAVEDELAVASPPPVWWWFATPAVLAATVAGLWWGAPAGAVALLWVTITVAASLLAPLRWGPSVALLGYAAVPVNYLAVPGSLQLLSPLVAGLGAWSLRLLLVDRRLVPNKDVVAAAVLLASWLAGISLLTSVDRTLSLKWCLAFGLGVLLPAVAGRAVAGTQRLVAATAVGIVGTLGCYAVVEALAQGNAPMKRVYDDFGLTQMWSVYRVTTTLGHPLSNSLFFATLFAFFFAMSVLRGGRACVRGSDHLGRGHRHRVVQQQHRVRAGWSRCRRRSPAPS